MQITKKMILNLIGLLDKHGLTNGAGNSANMFCIQQAVNRVIHDDLYGQYSDHPSDNCLNDTIRALGIRMNDCMGDEMDSKDRATALKRFAVAELGSHAIDQIKFFDMLAEKLELPKRYGVEMLDRYLTRSSGEGSRIQKLKQFADTAADILKELGTQGGEFLHLVDEPDKEKQKKEACKLGDQLYAARMADFGMTSCAVKPKQQH